LWVRRDILVVGCEDAGGIPPVRAIGGGSAVTNWPSGAT
jgi:hypothetical protein